MSSETEKTRLLRTGGWLRNSVLTAVCGLSISQIVLLGGILRIIVVYAGVIIDSYSPGGLRYTDIDYRIF